MTDKDEREECLKFIIVFKKPPNTPPHFVNLCRVGDVTLSSVFYLFFFLVLF